MKIVILTLAMAFVLACVGLPPTVPPASDPSNPRAAEARTSGASDVLRSDPPPAAALQAPGEGDEMEGGGMPMHHGHAEPHHPAAPSVDGGSR